jgi:hypothetical protein
MSFGGSPSPPPPPPPPPAPPSISQNTIAADAAAERARLAAAEGAGFSGTDVSGGQGVSPSSVSTTKSLLGG